MKKLCLVTTALFTLAACTQSPAPVADTREADVKAIQAVEQAGQKAWTAKDLDGILAQYASDATLIVPGAPVMQGTEALRGALTGMLADPALSMQIASAVTEVSKGGDLGYQRGSYKVTMSDAKTKKPVTESGSNVSVFKKQADGTWKIVEDINVAGPAQP
jgi:uncharacterized protein (TIGR02246 family)